MPEVPFQNLIPTDFSADQRQDAYVVFLENKPATEDEARMLLRRIHHRSEREWRCRHYQLIADPADMDTGVTPSCLYPALASLTDEDRELISAHYIEGLTFAEMESRFGIPHSTLHRRITAAVGALENKLRQSPE